MRLLAALTAAAVTLLGAADAGAAQYACFGPPADYLAAYDTVRGQTNNGRVDYPEQRVFLEVQGHIAAGDGTITTIHQREHIHMGACFPEGMRWRQPNASRTVDFRYVFHNVQDYNMNHIAGSIIDASGSNPGGFVVPSSRFGPLEQAMDASAHGTATAFQSYRMEPAANNGLKEFRFDVQVVEANTSAAVQVWFVETHWWMVFDYPGLGPAEPGVPANNLARLSVRNWFQQRDGQVSYHYGGFPGTVPGQPVPAPYEAGVNGPWTAANMRRAKPCGWRVSVNGTDGTNRPVLAVDPDFHQHHDMFGPWSFVWPVNMLGDDTLTAQIPTCSLSPGVHRLVYLADSLPAAPGVRPVSSAVQVIPIRVP